MMLLIMNVSHWLNSLPAFTSAFVNPIGDKWGAPMSVVEAARRAPRELRQQIEQLTKGQANPIVLPFQSYDFGVGTSDLASTETELSALLHKLDQLFRLIVDEFRYEVSGLEAFAEQYLNRDLRHSIV